MQRPFTKMHGLGNDFIVMDGRQSPVQLNAAQAQYLADRRFGVGCDQILLIEQARNADEDFFFRIFNADGSEAEQCGNGVRCVARWLAERTPNVGARLRLGSQGAVVQATLLDAGQVRVNLAVPRFAPGEIPFDTDAQAASYPLHVDGVKYEIGALSLGNPHAVLRVANIEQAPVATLGPQIETHSRFPQRANAGFLQVVERGAGRLRVWERGVGETLACGTGAAAAAVWGRLMGWFDETVTLHLPGGALVLSWQGAGQPVWMTGPAETVFEGTLTL